MNQKLRTVDIAYIALLAALLAVCAWITIPLPMVSFTLQTMGVFLALALLGGKRGTMAVLVYILLGAIGVPVFSGFKGGLGALFGTTGGYIFGFIFSALLYWLITRFLGEKLPVQIAAMVLGLLVCYIIGTAWFMFLYVRNVGTVTLSEALGWCIIPFIIPDLCKIALALLLGRRLRRFVK